MSDRSLIRAALFLLEIQLIDVAISTFLQHGTICPPSSLPAIEGRSSAVLLVVTQEILVSI